MVASSQRRRRIHSGADHLPEPEMLGRGQVPFPASTLPAGTSLFHTSLSHTERQAKCLVMKDNLDSEAHLLCATLLSFLGCLTAFTAEDGADCRSSPGCWVTCIWHSIVLAQLPSAWKNSPMGLLQALILWSTCSWIWMLLEDAAPN